jgi:hypothetical protein
VVHDDALALEQDVQPPIAEPPANARQPAQPRVCCRIVRLTAPIPYRDAIGSKRRTRPPTLSRYHDVLTPRSKSWRGDVGDYL